MEQESGVIDPWGLIRDLGGFNVDLEYPVFPSQPKVTSYGTSYLTKPGVFLISKPRFSKTALSMFLEGWDSSLGFKEYVNDKFLMDGTQLSKVAGQICYMSLGDKRTKNDQASKYFTNIKEQMHGSVLEHPSYSFIFTGISRSLTHELARHRHAAISQVSQRYVNGKVLRFVERPEYQTDEFLHKEFESRIDMLSQNYEATSKYLSKNFKDLEGESKTDKRKRVQQTSRSVLPNETEAPMVWSANARALRHVIEMRCNKHAEIEIRNLFLRVYLCMLVVEPILFEDYGLLKLDDGTYAVTTPYKKI